MPRGRPKKLANPDGIKSPKTAPIVNGTAEFNPVLTEKEINDLTPERKKEKKSTAPVVERPVQREAKLFEDAPSVNGHSTEQHAATVTEATIVAEEGVIAEAATSENKPPKVKKNGTGGKKAIEPMPQLRTEATDAPTKPMAHIVLPQPPAPETPSGLVKIAGDITHAIKTNNRILRVDDIQGLITRWYPHLTVSISGGKCTLTSGKESHTFDI